ncbi:membrane dipeptidase [Nocardioides sp. LHD-245]|uniref:dipeptidase n=1 Tax=Nocardioides sp. LHD-245 TaxID=3051387 RepID=UPI0027E0862D|nr:membrane dipeptidase [Nocardioides sp. LHD-245]
MTAMVADCHNDLLMAVRHLRERGHQDPFGDFWLPQLRSGGVGLQVLPVCTEEQYVGEGALRRCLLMLDEAHRLADAHAGDVAIVTTSRQLTETLEAGRIALVLAIEGAEPFGQSVELVDVLWRQGVRMCSLTWNRRTMMADGVGERDTGGRLTGLGVDTVRCLEDRGVVVDVSHLSEAGFFHLVEIASRPMIASHSSCRAVCGHPRNLSDAQLEILSRQGGFVAVNAFGPFLAETAPATVSDFVDHVEHAVSVMGAHAVGLGTDFIGDVAATVDPILTGLLASSDIPVTPGLERPADFPRLVTALGRRLGADLAARVAGKNLVEFLTRALP